MHRGRTGSATSALLRGSCRGGVAQLFEVGTAKLRGIDHGGASGGLASVEEGGRRLEEEVQRTRPASLVRLKKALGRGRTGTPSSTMSCGGEAGSNAERPNQRGKWSEEGL